MTGPDSPVGSRATTCSPAGTSAVANSPLAMLVNTTVPSTRTSAGATVAVCATSTRALPGPIGSVGVWYDVTSASPPTEAGRWSTTSWLDPAATSSVVAWDRPSGPEKSTWCSPALSLYGPSTLPGATPEATVSPSTTTSTSVPGTAWTMATWPTAAARGAWAAGPWADSANAAGVAVRAAAAARVTKIFTENPPVDCDRWRGPRGRGGVSSVTPRVPGRPRMGRNPQLG